MKVTIGNQTRAQERDFPANLTPVTFQWQTENLQNNMMEHQNYCHKNTNINFLVKYPVELGHEQIYYTNFNEWKLLSLGALEEYRQMISIPTVQEHPRNISCHDQKLKLWIKSKWKKRWPSKSLKLYLHLFTGFSVKHIQRTVPGLGHWIRSEQSVRVW